MSGTLYIVATPIGNLEDLTPRARKTLAAVDLIAAEDTRHTGRLLSHIGAKTPQIALHEHNESAVVDRLLAELAAGRSVALVSDAGTPLISDPGYRVVSAAHDSGIGIVPIPGASALTAALAAAGLPTDRFAFEGFLPSRPAARRAALKRLKSECRTMVFFEAVHRISRSVEDLAQVFGDDREAFIGRELSKLHEQCVRDSLRGLAGRLADGSIPARGEFVVIVAGAREAPAAAVDVDTLIMELRAVLPGKQAAAVAAKATGGKRNDLYARMLELTGKR